MFELFATSCRLLISCSLAILNSLINHFLTCLLMNEYRIVQPRELKISNAQKVTKLFDEF